jgi:hypothetical protein
MCIQISIYFIYANRSDGDAQPKTTVISSASDVNDTPLSVIIDTLGKDKLDRKDSLECIAIRSPSTSYLFSVSIARH